LVWELAGLVGLDPGPLTLRELVAMAEARLAHDWARGSMLMALLANCHRDPKKNRAFKPEDFNPLHQAKAKDKPVAKTKDLSILKQVFVDNAPIPNSEGLSDAQRP